MAKISFTLLILVSMMLTNGSCQTFQYSRGWTNGKRAENGALGSAGFQTKFKIANFPVQLPFNSRSSDVVASPSLVNHCGLQKLKMMLQGNGNEQLYLLPCELLGDLQSSYQSHRQLQQEQQEDMMPAVGHYRRTPSSEYNINNNNY